MWTRVSVVTPPVAMPMTIADLKTRLRIDHADEDALLAGYLAGAVARIDGPKGIGWGMMTQTWRLTLDAFPSGSIVLPGAPIKSVSSVSYVNLEGATQTMDLADHRLDAGGEPARLAPAFQTSWPAAQAVIGAVSIDYVVGEADAADVPADLVDAVALLVGHRYENREAAAIGVMVMKLPFSVESIVNEYRQSIVAA